MEQDHEYAAFIEGVADDVIQILKKKDFFQSSKRTYGLKVPMVGKTATAPLNMQKLF